MRSIWKNWSIPAKTLFAARFLRSITQGCLVVDFTLYLRFLHWSATSIGALLAGSFVLGALLSLLVGPASDRMGSKLLLVFYEIAVALAFFTTACTIDPWAIGCAAVFAGFGRGANGAPGCFVPAELNWLSRLVRPGRLGAAYSVNTAMGFIGMGVGALLAIVPALVAGTTEYRPLFLMGGGIALVIAALLAITPEARARRTSVSKTVVPIDIEVITKKTDRYRMGQIVVINVFSGISLGLSGPLIAYWFAVKFHLDALHIGPVLAMAFFASAFAAFTTGWLAETFGSARVFVAMQAVGTLLLFSFPFIPSFSLAAMVWILRFAIERGATGAMEAVIVGLVGFRNRGLAGGISTASLALPRALGPIGAGRWIAEGDLMAPFLTAAVLQTVYAVLFGIAFMSRDRDITNY